MYKHIKKQWNRKLSKHNRYEFIQKQGILMCHLENETHAAVCMTKLTVGRPRNDPVFDHLLAVCDNREGTKR